MGVIVVSGALANKPGNGGAAWTRLSWILGLKRLGHDVYFVEQIAPAASVGVSGAPCGPAESVNASFFRTVIDRYGLSGRAALLTESGGHVAGVRAREIEAAAAKADLLVNISGHLTLPSIKERCARRAFVDLDPGYTQFWLEQGLAADRVDGHDTYFTVGENIGNAGCTIPTAGILWQPIRQPVLLNEWPAVPPTSNLAFTTVASWRGPFGRVSSGGVLYGVKAHEFRKFAALPSMTRWPLEIALEAHAADREDVAQLARGGWRIADATVTVDTPCAFRHYVQQSAAEFSVAQGIYVETQSGWFSDRTVRYLASGRPALVQDTCFRYPSGCGLVAFRTLDEAAAGAEAIAGNYDAHARAARALAEAHFDSDKVLAEFLEQAR